MALWGTAVASVMLKLMAEGQNLPRIVRDSLDQIWLGIMLSQSRYWYSRKSLRTVNEILRSSHLLLILGIEIAGLAEEFSLWGKLQEAQEQMVSTTSS